MGRKVEEKFAHGTYTAEFIKALPLPPLGNDRKTIILPDTAADKLLNTASGTLGVFLSILMKAFRERWGDEVWEVAEKAMKDFGLSRAGEFIKRLNIDIHDARSIGRILDFEDNASGVKGEWVEYGKKRAIKREYYCPQARWYTDCPEVCTRMMNAMEAGTFEALGIKLKPGFFSGKILPDGAPYCEAVIELAD